ncbi:hypothetical protein ABHF33_12805 [Chitinibacter sp. FCG-7]|uniref:Uncharacterized protein n=1 Tax=Chitinibacter mangrovi TaxID=3153927 RepID=A0AAU7F876_9NEIS
METALEYLQGTKVAAESLFQVLDQYQNSWMRSFVDCVNSENITELRSHKEMLFSIDLSREVIAGSILQIAHAAIETYPPFNCEKAGIVVDIERTVNAYIKSGELKKLGKSSKLNGDRFSFPKKFCCGRLVADLPVGLIIYAGRNQYNHFGEVNRKLSPQNEAIFRHLNLSYPALPNGICFDLDSGRTEGRKRQFFSWSILCALGWVRQNELSGFDVYLKDLRSILCE